MPMYDYTCSACGERFEAIVRMTRSEEPACPRCGASETRKSPLARFNVGGSGGATPQPMGGPCGSCGDPRGPGACRLE